ncbi:peptidylprolyl isomerase [Frondihabitans sucicola]|uniref:Peptidylprolyl isomerase n=1 Tax=Frondihabitans sucicola TaxID=1268041 RepID=A0ABM8GQ29_9MICO|nr:hypothetical protein [Frondihabitans sucicola]BDZ50543.1 peptidylprolyl isomerase [Frondihabitans sucicola]
MRKLPALIVVAGLLATLTACSTSAAPGSAGCTTPASGDASSVVTATGAFGSKPTVKIPTPVNTKHTEVSTLIQGHGQILTDGTPSLIKYTIYSGKTGKEVSSSSYSKPTTPITVGATKGGPLVDALECSQVGSRLAVAVKASELTTSTSGTAAKPNGKSGPAYIAVIDVVKAFLPKADGALQAGVNNMPAVVTAANGAPGISIPDTAAPKAEKVQVVRKGSGATLTAKDTAIVQFTAVDWASAPTVQGSTWTDGDAATTVALSSKTLPSSIKKALVGQKVGSQVMVVVPPTASSGSATTYVYVFDVLGAL